MLRALGLRARLVLLVLVALAPMFALVAWETARKQGEALDTTRERLLSQARLAVAAQERLTERTRNLLEAVGNAPALREADPADCMRYFAGLLAQYPAYNSMGLVSAEGELVCSSREARSALPQASRDLLQQMLTQRRFLMGGYERSARTGREQVLFGAPVLARDGGGVTAVVFASLRIDAVAAALGAAVSDGVEGSATLVLDHEGVVLAAWPAPAAEVGSRVTEDVVLQALERRVAGAELASDSAAVPREWGFARIADASGTQLLVAVSAPRATILAPVLADFRWQLTVLLLSALGGGLAAWWMGEWLMARPARALLEKARAVADGDLGARVPVAGSQPPEISRLGATFNQMAQALQSRQSELDRTLRDVEQEHALLDLVINNMSEGVVAADTDGRLLLFNAAARGLFRAPEGVAFDAGSLGHELCTPDGESLPVTMRPLARAIRGESLDAWEALARQERGPDRVLSFGIRPLLDLRGELIGGLVVVTDITERRHAEEFEHGQEQVLEMIAGGVPLGEILEAVIRLVERRADGGCCSVLVNQEGVLRRGAAVSLPEPFLEATDGLAVAEGESICGTAAARRQMVVVKDVANDPLARHYRDLAGRFDVVSCWSMPVIGAWQEVLAVFAVYHGAAREPDPEGIALLEVATRLVRLAIERSRAEDALRASEGRFRELAENIQDVFYSYDPRTRRILYVSPAYETLWGRSSASLLEDPSTWTASVHPDDRVRVDGRRAAGALQQSDIQYRVIRPDGSVRWVQDHSYPVAGPAGEPERVVGIARDITPRKQADIDLMHTNRALQMLSRGNEALVRAEDEQELLLEICRLAVNVGGYEMAWVGYALDDDERTIQPQAWAGNELGYLTEITLTWDENDPRGQGPAGRTIRSGHVVVSEDIMAESVGFHWRAQAFERGFRSMICLPLHDGQRNFGLLALFSGMVTKTRWEEVKLLQELAANLAYGISSLRARAEQRRTEHAMREANERLLEQASLLDRARDAIIVRSVDHKLVRYWNKGAERLYGWSAAEAIGRPMYDRMYDDIEQFERAMAALLEHGEWVGELQQRSRDGRVLTVEGRWTLVRDTEGRPHSVLAINTDVGERKRARDQILRLNAELEDRVQRRTAQLSAANKELEAFSYSVSHDLRTPLNAIDGFSHLLERSLAASPDERQKHFLARIRSGTRQMGELIEGLLLLSQITRAAMREEKVDLGALAEQSLAAWRERDPQRPVAARVESGLVARGDPRLLRQVIENLVGNAWKFSSHHPEPEIAVGTSGFEDGWPVYFVRDNGAGFDMAHAGKLFGAFQRLHSVTDFPGTGIGLATVQRIVKRHGGRIWAESAPGRGATFFFTLPGGEAG
ncbi:MAG: PAS domain S-box protein [Burkholderiales bacterium]|nr:PAS domain S-box protein [Burkholderiales bacterium]